MKLGVRAHDYGRHEVNKLADILHSEGYRAAQVAIPRAFSEVDSLDDVTEDLLYKIKEAFDRADIEISVLSCYQDLGNPNEEVRKNAVAIFKKCLGYAKICGAKVVGTETSYAHLSKVEKHIWFPYMMESLKELRDEAERVDQWMAIEPVAWHPLEDVETTLEVINELDSNHVKVIFDMANVLERPYEINQIPYWNKCFDMLDPYIETIHLKDFTVGDNGEYIPKLLGEGLMDYSVFTKWLSKHKDMPVMREEMDPSSATKDIAVMKRLGGM